MINLALDLWREILWTIDSDRPVLQFCEPENCAPELLADLTAAGVLRQSPPGRTATCRQCPESPSRDVIFTESPAEGLRALFPCPNCGLYEIPLDHLRSWLIKREVIATLIRHSLGLSGRQREVEPGRLWRLGRFPDPERSWSVWLGCRLQRSDLAEVLARAKLPPRTLLLVPDRSPKTPLPEGVETGSLRELSWWGNGAIEFDGDGLDELLARHEPALQARKRPAPTRRQTRAADIEALVFELTQHLRAARSYAVQTRDATGVPALLTRPTQKELAQRLALTESRVSRSLNDPDARQLQLLWNLANDLDGVLRFA